MKDLKNKRLQIKTIISKWYKYIKNRSQDHEITIVKIHCESRKTNLITILLCML